jgi:hypothetical protein
MIESATNVVVGFRELRTFCENVGELLTMTNELMTKGGWERISKWVAATEISTNLDSPEYWLPHAFFCFYSDPTSEHLLAFVAVHVDDLWNERPSVLEEPLICAGYCDYGVGQKAIDEWKKDYAVCGSHLWITNRQDDGTVHVTDASEIWDETPKGSVRVSTFAYPIAVVTDGEALKQKIVQPLLSLLSQNKSRP